MTGLVYLMWNGVQFASSGEKSHVSSGEVAEDEPGEPAGAQPHSGKCGG